ncbi:MAG: c-type cytochrome [Cyclobacteriaceae bacterium]|nr:c-type cytochrome [Cyclobacteriaceae bacterium]
MKNLSLLTVSMFAFIIVLGTMAFSTLSDQQDNKWVVPEDANNMENPYVDDEELLSIGKTLYMQHCKSCHGKEGLGDGPKAEGLDTPSGDFSVEEFQSQTDGSIFYKTQEGKGDMPSFKKKIAEEEDMWSVVNYLRTLAE